MPKKSKGGKGHKKSATVSEGARKVEYKKEGQEYGKIIKALGNKRFSVQCGDGKIRIAHVPGSFRRRIWIAANDFVLLNTRDYQDEKSDIVYKYLPNEAKKLVKNGEISKLLFGEEQDELFQHDSEDEYEKKKVESSEDSSNESSDEEYEEPVKKSSEIDMLIDDL